MTKTLIIITIALFSCSSGTNELQQSFIPQKRTLETIVLVNDYFIKKIADSINLSDVDITLSGNIATNALFYEGLMALYSIFPQESYYQYALNWGNNNKWDYRNGSSTRNAINYGAGQTYIDIYRLSANPEHIRKVKANLNMLVNTPQNDDWWCIDAIHMGMPVFAKLGKTLNESKYYEKMWNMYEQCRNKTGGAGLFNRKEGLWWRDKDFTPPYKEPNGEDCYWSRGNGWVYAALVRVLDEIPLKEKHRNDYINDFKQMTTAIVKCQRKDGFWNVSLHDESNFAGRELTGTSLFVYGITWGINNGLLNRDQYLPIVMKAWNNMVKEAVHPNGFLGYVQGRGKEPKDGQPITYDSIPDLEDYGVGCFLLAGVEIYKLK